MIHESNLERSLQVELASLMRKLKREGMLRAPRMQLLELVGYQNDAAGAWSRIREAFEDVGGDAAELYGTRLQDGDVVIVVGRMQSMDRF